MGRSQLVAAAALVLLLWACPSPHNEPVLPTTTPATTAAPTSSATAQATSAAPRELPLPRLSEAEKEELGKLMKQVVAACKTGDYVDSWSCPRAAPWREHELLESGKAEAWLLEQLRTITSI